MKRLMISKSIPGLVALLGLTVFILLTSPQNLPLPMLFVPFVLLFFVIFSFSSLIISLFMPKLAKSKRVTIAAVCAALPSMLLVLQSIGQSSLPDLLIATVLVVVFGIYFSKN